MVCPRCASNQSDDVKFCTSCGANLQAVREALALKDTDKKFNWNETWFAEMFRSGEIAEQRKLEMERRFGITPEVKRYNEIKAGVITSSVGISLAIFLFVFMPGIAAGVPQQTAEILVRLWVAGAIPFFVGLALIINGLVVSRKQAEIIEREMKRVNDLEGKQVRELNEFAPTPFSVTDHTTRHLINSDPDRERGS